MAQTFFQSAFTNVKIKIIGIINELAKPNKKSHIKLMWLFKILKFELLIYNNFSKYILCAALYMN